MLLEEGKFFERVISGLRAEVGFDLNDEAISALYNKRKALLKDDKLSKYSPEELDALEADIRNIVSATFANVKSSAKPHYVASAGAPCVGKSTQLEIMLSQQDNWPVYVSPDRGAIQGISTQYLREYDYTAGAPFPAKGMLRTYWAMNKDQDHNACYNHWREASIWISELVFLLAVAHKFDICHDTTHTSKFSFYTFDVLKEYGYNIEVLMMTASDDARRAAKGAREIMQVTDEDFKSKVLSGEQVNMFMKYADKISLFYNDEKFVEADSQKSWRVLAEYDKSTGGILNSPIQDLPEGTTILASVLQQQATPESPNAETPVKEVASTAEEFHYAI